ncbi:hypothetical protein AAC387_Pa03g4254 [Persea americana]
MSFGAFECEAATGSEIDREALLAIKAHIRKDPLGALISWNDTLPFCMWLGVTCISRDQRVMFLDLSSLNLEGSVSPFIGNLSYLVGINFQVNNLDGEIPHEIGNLFNLQLLNLSYNFFQANEFSSDNLIGVGSLGSVYKGILNKDEKVVAVKVLNLENRGALKSIVAECETLINVQHRNLIKVMTVCSSADFKGNDFKALVFEYLPNGNLDKWLHLEVDGQNHLHKLTFTQRVLLDMSLHNMDWVVRRLHRVMYIVMEFSCWRCSLVKGQRMRCSKMV